MSRGTHSEKIKLPQKSELQLRRSFINAVYVGALKAAQIAHHAVAP